ncbi:MAG: hypothetical protein U0Q07_20345 [Acidimicrobiales bacterium]
MPDPTNPNDPMPPGDPSGPSAGGPATPSGPGLPDDELTSRLGSYLGDVAAEPLPDDLDRLTGAQLRATAGDPRASWLEDRRWLVAAAAGVLVVLLLATALVRRGGDDEVRIDSAGTTLPTTALPPTSAGTTPGTGAAPDGYSSTVSSSTTSSEVAPTVPSTNGPIPPSTATSPSVAPTVVPTPPAPTTTAVPAGQVLLSDDFSGDPLGSVPAGWTVGSGEWRVAIDGATHYAKTTTTAPGEGRLSSGSATWTDYTVAAKVVGGAGSTIVGLGARYQGPNDYLFCKADAGRRLLYVGVFQGGVARVLASQPYVLPTNRQQVALRFTVQGSALTCGVDGGPTLRATDATFAAGAVALLGSDNGAATAVVVATV